MQASHILASRGIRHRILDNFTRRVMSHQYNQGKTKETGASPGPALYHHFYSQLFISSFVCMHACHVD